MTVIMRPQYLAPPQTQKTPGYLGVSGRKSREMSYEGARVLCDRFTPLGSVWKDSRGRYYLQAGEVRENAKGEKFGVPTGVQRLTPEQVEKLPLGIKAHLMLESLWSPGRG